MTDNNKMLGSKGDYDLNQSSAGNIPINSMYEGEEERKAAIPPPLEGTEEKIDEAPEIAAQGASERVEEQPGTTETETRNKSAVEEKPSNIGKAESNTNAKRQDS